MFELSVGEVVRRRSVEPVLTAVFLVEQCLDECLDESRSHSRPLVAVGSHHELQNLFVVVGLPLDGVFAAPSALHRRFEIEKREPGEDVRNREVDDVLFEVGHSEPTRVSPHVILGHIVVFRDDEDRRPLGVVVQRQHIVDEGFRLPRAGCSEPAVMSGQQSGWNVCRHVFGLAGVVEGIPDCHPVSELTHEVLVRTGQRIPTLLFRTRPPCPFDSKLFRGGDEDEVREFSAAQDELRSGLSTASRDLTIQEPLQRRSGVSFFRGCPEAAVAYPFGRNLVVRSIKRVEYRDQ